MLIVISPSKTLDFSCPINGGCTQPEFLGDSFNLIKALRKLKVKDIASLMDLSEKLSKLNWQRYKDFTLPFTPENARQAIYSFKGDVYNGLAAEKLTGKDVEYAQEHLRIISGLYGLLKPLDLIQPYRLEMGTKLANPKGKDLYKFWGDRITQKLNEELDNSNILVNLASDEYFKVINPLKIVCNIVTPVFKEKKGDTYKIVMLYAKQARGMMAAYIIKNQLVDSNDIKSFNVSGYKFNKSLSSPNKPVFTR